MDDGHHSPTSPPERGERGERERPRCGSPRVARAFSTSRHTWDIQSHDPAGRKCPLVHSSTRPLVHSFTLPPAHTKRCAGVVPAPLRSHAQSNPSPLFRPRMKHCIPRAGAPAPHKHARHTTHNTQCTPRDADPPSEQRTRTHALAASYPRGDLRPNMPSAVSISSRSFVLEGKLNTKIYSAAFASGRCPISERLRTVLPALRLSVSGPPAIWPFAARLAARRSPSSTAIYPTLHTPHDSPGWLCAPAGRLSPPSA
jgi:hypothetical protein